MTTMTARRLARAVVVTLCALGSAGPVHAQIEIGTWVRTDAEGAAAKMSMTVETWRGSGRRLIYRLTGKTEMVLTVESPMDGTDSPVLFNGTPSGETMAIKRVDEHHATAVLKMDGKVYGTSKATLSSDGKTLTVEDDITDAIQGRMVGKKTETWVRK